MFKEDSMPTNAYDIVLSSPFSNYDFFAHKLRELCGQMSLSFYQVDDVWIKEFTDKLKAREVSVRVMLDLTANQTIEDDPYMLLAREVKRQRGTVIDDPDKVSIVAHKGRFHNMLVENNIPVPDTIVIERRELETFKISDEIKRRIGVPFVVKPAWGDSGVGVNINGSSEQDLYRSAEEAPNSDSFLIQKRLEMQDLGNYKGWFRLWYVCGEVIPCWWDPSSHEYTLVTPGDVSRYELGPLQEIMRGIAKVSEMTKFSSEICLHTDGKFYAADYINADPDMNPRSFYANGVPDEVVRYIVWLLFNEAFRIVKRGQGFFDEDLTQTEESRDWLEQRRREQRAT
jgi:hypothetical protein